MQLHHLPADGRTRSISIFPNRVKMPESNLRVANLTSRRARHPHVFNSDLRAAMTLRDQNADAR
jgi:hypothetical protein